MARRHHYRLRNKQPMELDVTTFLNLMVVLVPFLLITAVFSRITIVELTLPSSSGGASSEPAAFRVEVIVREDGLEIRRSTDPMRSKPATDVQTCKPHAGPPCDPGAFGDISRPGRRS